MFYVFYIEVTESKARMPVPYPNRSSLLFLAVSKDDSFF